MRKCPVTGCREECGVDCEWYVYDKHTESRGCVIVALARELTVTLATLKNLSQKARP